MIRVCYHCGDVVPVNVDLQVEILGQQRAMCCPGCQSVAKTIVDSGLTSYYEYRTEQAAKVQLVPEELQALINYDNADIQADFVFKHEKLDEVTLSLDGVSCAACAWLIEKQVSNLLGVEFVRVNTVTNRAMIRWDSTKIKLSQLLTTIHQLGYKAAPFDADEQEALYHQSMKRYLYRLGIAGLASMQVMMLAVALYLEVFGDLDSGFKSYFRWVSLIFATPVLLYSALPFYFNAWRSLRGMTFGMDVPVSLALLFAYSASFIATITGQGDVYFESVSMFTFFLLVGRYLEAKARHQAAAASGNLLKLVPAFATLVNGQQVPVKSLQVGDLVRVLPGEHIPADGLVLKGITHVDESMLSGESEPLVKNVGDVVYAGTVTMDEGIELEVTKAKIDSMIHQIVRLQDDAQSSKPQIALLADTIARYFVAAILVIAASTWLYWHYHASQDAFWIMLSVLVVTCPCALSLATPTAITCATSLMGRNGLLLRKSHVFETLCKVNHLVIDKTGTLTLGKIAISDVICHASHSQQECYAIAAAIESYANHPIAHAFKPFFDSHYQVFDVMNHIGQGLEGVYLGQKIKIGSAKFVLGDSSTIAQKAVYLSLNNSCVATFICQDPLREDAALFIDSFHRANIKVSLLTGDSNVIAENLAKQLKINHVIAECSPSDKLSFLRSLPNNTVSMMVGDGINDSPILAGAHLSVAMGGGTDIAKASADMVLLNDNLGRLLIARQLAFKTRKIIRQNLCWALAYNFAILPLAVMGLIAPYIAVIGMSASSIIVVSNSIRLLKN
jgi:P-type Cu2+ transporter